MLLSMGLCCAISFTSCLKQKEDTPNPLPPGGTVTYDWPAIADSASLSITNFWLASGLYFTKDNNSTEWVNYWPSAHGLDVLVDAYLRTNGSGSVKGQMDAMLIGMKAKNGNTWLNYYYDDMEWMGLACLRAYEATNDIAYKEIADIVWSDIKKGWSSDLGGGIWWRKDNSSKNTPSNMPAAILAARMYKKFNRAEDLQWAKQIYDWQKLVLYDASSGWVYDNIDKNGNKNVTWKFTYNQGTFLGAALELYKLTGDASYFADAVKAADYAVGSGFLTTNGILKNEGGGDGGLFKGVFVRYFTRLIIEGNLEDGKKTAYLNFITNNAKTLWSKGATKLPVLFNGDWNSKPGGTTDFTIQLSGIMLLEAMAELKSKSLVD